MHLRALLGAAVAALGITSASAAMVITDDAGGSINAYTQRYAAARDSGEQVIIDGLCFSTMALGMLPRGHVCVTKNALLGFHAAWHPSAGGGRVASADHTQKLMDVYPQPVRAWIARRGGLGSEMIYLHGRELRALVPACKEGRTNVASRGPNRASPKAAGGLEFSSSAKGLGRGY